jgi:hypothetical protein
VVLAGVNLLVHSRDSGLVAPDGYNQVSGVEIQFSFIEVRNLDVC